MTMSTHEMHELRIRLESLRREWPAFGDARTLREQYIAASIDVGLAMLEVCGAGQPEEALQRFQRGEIAGAAAIPTGVKERAVTIALANYRLVLRLIEQDNFSDKAFRKDVVREVALLTEQAAEISQMAPKYFDE